MGRIEPGHEVVQLPRVGAGYDAREGTRCVKRPINSLFFGPYSLFGVVFFLPCLVRCVCFGATSGVPGVQHVDLALGRERELRQRAEVLLPGMLLV